MFEKLMQRIKLIVGTGIATRVQTKIVQIKMATGITNDRIKRVHNYGFMSRPLPGAKAYTQFIGGDTSRGIAVLIEDERYEMELQPGEVAVLDDKGNLVHFTDAGITVHSPKAINVSCKTAAITADKTTINGDAEINGKTTLNGETILNGQTTLNGAVTNSGGISIDGIGFGLHRHDEHDGYATSTPK